MRRPTVKGVRVQSGWQVDQVASEASWVQMCRAFWEGHVLSGHVMAPGLFLRNLPLPIPLHPSIPLCLHPSPFSPSSSPLPVLQKGCQRLLILWGKMKWGRGYGLAKASCRGEGEG